MHRTLIVGATFALASPLIAQPCSLLYDTAAWYTANAPRSVKCLDLNGDGFDDILAAGRRGNIAVHLNAGDGTMLPAVFLDAGAPGAPTGTETEDIAVADLNGDGFPDFAIANVFSKSLQTFINDGSGGFTLLDTIPSPNTHGFGAVCIGDPNDDGLPDLVGVQPGPDFLQLYRALPGGGYDAPLQGFLINTPLQAEFGDADGDGLDDLFVIANDGPNPTGAPATLAVFRNGGFDGETGAWLGYNTLAIFNPTTHPTPYDLELADMDNNGTLDAVVLTNLLFDDRGFVEYMPNTGNGTFGPSQVFEVNGSANGLDIGDVDGNGLLDVVVANFNNEDEVTVLRRVGASLLGGAPVDLSDIASFEGANDLATDVDLGDLDGDGALDFAIGCIGGQSVNAMVNDGEGNFALNSSFRANEPQCAGLVSIDIDDDGDEDLVSFTDIFNVTKFITISTNDGAGNFTPGPPLDITGGRHTGPVAADFNGDGREDILYRLFETQELNILFNNGDGTLTAGTPFGTALQTFTNNFGVLDANGDGAPDIFAMGQPNGSSVNRNVLFLNDGMANFTDASAGFILTGFNTAPFPYDLDGDGDTDLVTTDLFYNVHCLRNNGDNTFTDMGAIANPETFGNNTVVDDFDGDGNPDIAVANTGRREVAVFLGDGTDFSFDAPVFYPVGPSCRDLTVGDADGDGDPDLYLHLDQGNTINESQMYALGVLINHGDGTFGPATGYHCRGRLTGLELADFNDDGRLDAAVGVNTFHETVFVFLQRSCDASAVCLGDCDGSGTVDFNDLVSMLFEFGTPVSNPGCDADETGNVDFNDLVTALFLFGPCP
ncbi:MAG: VCBS repeat-containing protein [Phycisphaerales bacterium]